MRVTPRAHLYLFLASFGLLLPAMGRADDPKYEFAKPEEVKDVVWKAAAQAGLVFTYGNSQILTASGGFNASRNDGKNKLALDVAGIYAVSWVQTIVDYDMSGAIEPSEICSGYGTCAHRRQEQETANNWLARFRYDRFFTARNSGYINAFVGQDTIAGKSLMTGGQIGYSRLLLHSERNELAAEIGYDISYVRYTADNTPPVLIHSIRAFLGYVLTLSKATAINASVEGLFNVNPIDVGPCSPDAPCTTQAVMIDPNTHHGPFDAFRIYGKAGITTQIYKNISIKFQYTARYDNAPAPLDVKPFKLASPAARADALDMITEGAIVVTFL